MKIEDKVRVKKEARNFDLSQRERKILEEKRWEGVISSPAYFSGGWIVEFSLEKGFSLVHIFEEHELEVIK